MTLNSRSLSLIAGAFAIGALIASPAYAVDPSRLLAADQNPNDWLTYHGSYRSYHFSPQEHGIFQPSLERGGYVLVTLFDRRSYSSFRPKPFCEKIPIELAYGRLTIFPGHFRTRLMMNKVI